MKSFKFIPVGLLYVHPHGNDLIVHGDPKRTEAEVLAPTIPEEANVYPIETLDAETHVRISGPMTLHVPSSTSLFVGGDADDVVIQKVAHAALENCSGDLVASELTSLRVNGDIKGAAALRKIVTFANLQDVKGAVVASDIASLRTDDVRRDVNLSNIGEVQVAVVGGDFAVAHAISVQIKEVSGDVKINSVKDTIAIKRIGGDLEVISPGTTLAATEVLGNVQLKGPLQKNGKYWINAAGAVVVRISGDVRIAVRASGEINAGSDLDIESEKGGLVTAQLGSDELAADLNIVSGSDVFLNSPRRWQKHRRAVINAELQKTYQEVQEELQQTLGAAGKQVKSVAADIAGQVQRQPAPEAIVLSIQDVVREIINTLEETSVSPQQSDKSAAPSDEELQLILKMLESGTITADEAEEVIDALYGSRN